MLKIAIVEDDKSIAEMYRLKFEADGDQVVTAENGKKGLEAVEKQRSDVVLLDLMMPVMTGDEMLREMRNTDWGKNIKVYILTNVTKDDAMARFKDLKVDGYIVKAYYTPQEVVNLVKATLDKTK